MEMYCGCHPYTIITGCAGAFIGYMDVDDGGIIPAILVGGYAAGTAYIFEMYQIDANAVLIAVSMSA